MYSENFEAELSKLKADKISGSEEIVRKAIQIVDQEIQNNSEKYANIIDLTEMLREVMKVKREMAALRNVLIYFIDFFQKGVAVEDLADRVIDKMDDQRVNLNNRFVPFLTKCKNIATFSRSSTIVSGLIELKKSVKEEELTELTIFESRPALEGKKLALETANLGFKINYFVDAGIAIALQTLKPDAVIIGADTIFPNGNVVNKIGCHSLALFAFQNKIPFYVVSTSLKLLLKAIPFSIQSYAASDIWSKEKPETVKIYNPYFELVPANLISGFFTEVGFSEAIPDVKIGIEKDYIHKMYE